MFPVRFGGFAVRRHFVSFGRSSEGAAPTCMWLPDYETGCCQTDGVFKTIPSFLNILVPVKVTTPIAERTIAH